MTAEIKRQILLTLKQCQPFALPEKTLHYQVNFAIRPPINEDELAEFLISMRSQKLIDFILDDLDESVRKWHITEAGKALLQK